MNIKNVSLLEALRSPLFRAYQQRQPFNKNHLRPCPLLDNPKSLKEVVRVSAAYSTDMLKPENVDELTGKCTSTAEKWGVVADHIWYGRPVNQGGEPLEVTDRDGREAEKFEKEKKVREREQAEKDKERERIEQYREHEQAAEKEKNRQGAKALSL